MAHVSGAESWSKDRIREEIADRRREIDNINDNIREREEDYEDRGWDDAPPNWDTPLLNERSTLEDEIDYLKSLL
jgi:hypothetical protein